MTRRGSTSSLLSKLPAGNRFRDVAEHEPGDVSFFWVQLDENRDLFGRQLSAAIFEARNLRRVVTESQPERLGRSRECRREFRPRHSEAFTYRADASAALGLAN